MSTTDLSASQVEHFKAIDGNLYAKEVTFKPKDWNVGTLLAYRMEEAGVKDYFVIPGDFNLILLDQILLNEKLRMIGCCNELNAGYAADGYARARGLSVVFVTYSVGGLSLVNAISGAYAENAPVVVISGGLHSHDYTSDAVVHHTTCEKNKDQLLNIYKEVTAMAVRIEKAQTANVIIKEAFQTALMKRKPVYIEIACNLARAPVPPPAPMAIHKAPRPDKHMAELQLDAVMGYWKNAKRPAILIGQNVRPYHAMPYLPALAEKLGCAVAVLAPAKSLFPEDHPNYVGIYWGAISYNGAREVMENADLIIGLGCVWDDLTTMGYSIPIAKKTVDFISVDVVRGLQMPNGQHYEMANLPAFVKFLTENLPANNASLKGYKRPEMALQVAASPSSAPLTREQLWSRIQAYAKPEHGFIVDAGDSWFNAQFLNLPRGARYEAQMSYASIGWSVGAGLGYSVAAQHEGRKAVIVVGDGAAQMTIQEISTMIRYRQPVLMIVVDNEGYQIEEVLHKGPYNFIANWPFHALAKAFVSTTDKGAEDFTVSMLVKTETELVQAFKQVEERPNRFYLVHCKIGAEDVSKKLLEFGASMMKWNGRTLSSVMTEGCNWA